LVKNRRFSRIYFGWWIALVTAILSGLAAGFFLQGVSALFKPISFELGLNRAGASVAAGIGTVMNAFGFALAGWLSDRLGPKWVVVTGICLMGSGLILMNYIVSPGTYYIVWGAVIGAGHGLGFTVAHDKMLTDWFVRKRGLALGGRFAFMGIMAVIVLPLISWLIAVEGWRITCLIWAGVMFICIPFALYFFRQKRPEYYGLFPDGAALEVKSEIELNTDMMVAKGKDYAASFQETEFTLKQILRTPSYWLLCANLIIFFIIFGSFNVHCIPFLTDNGIDPIVAGSMMAMMVFFTIPSRLLAGGLADRFKKHQLRFLLSGSLMLTSFGITAFLINQTYAMLYVLLVFFGLGSGSYIVLNNVIIGRYFGRKAYGSNQGIAMILAAPMSLLAMVYTGWIYDSTGSYLNALMIFAALAISGALLVFLARPSKLPTTV